MGKFERGFLKAGEWDHHVQGLNFVHSFDNLLITIDYSS